MKFDRSKWPTHSTSMPSTAAICSTFSSPRSVSICAMTSVRACRRRDLVADVAAEVVAVREAERRARAGRPADSGRPGRWSAPGRPIRPSGSSRRARRGRAPVRATCIRRAAPAPSARSAGRGRSRTATSASRSRGRCAPCRRARTRQPALARMLAMPGAKNSKTIAPATVLPARMSCLMALGFMVQFRVRAAFAGREAGPGRHGSEDGPRVSTQGGARRGAQNFRLELLAPPSRLPTQQHRRGAGRVSLEYPMRNLIPALRSILVAFGLAGAGVAFAQAPDHAARRRAVQRRPRVQPGAREVPGAGRASTTASRSTSCCTRTASSASRRTTSPT